MAKVKNKTGHTKGTEIGKDCSLCYADGLYATQELGVGAGFKNTKVVWCSEVTLLNGFWLVWQP